LLAALLAHAGWPVSFSRLAEAVWDDRPPATAAEQLANSVSKLRAELNRAGDAPPIGRTAAGYSISRNGQELDLDVFQERIATAYKAVDRRDLTGGVVALRSAIDVWRGPALAGLDGAYLRAVGDRLDELKVAVLEDLGWLELRRGNPDAVTGLIDELVFQHPFRERLVALQMLLLSRAGRRSEAIAAYARLRAALATQLGIDPQPELAHLQREILRGVQPDVARWATRPSGTNEGLRVPLLAAG